MYNTPTEKRRLHRSRKKIVQQRVIRLAVNRTPQHIYAQVILPGNGHIVAAASSVEAAIKANIDSSNGKKGIAELVGKLVAERAFAKGVTKVAFDRSGLKYHGRIKALADAARANGLEF